MIMKYLSWVIDLRCMKILISSLPTLEFEITIFNFSSIFVCRCCINVCRSKEESNLNCFIFNWLRRFSNIDAEFSQLFYTPLVYKLDLSFFCHEEDYSHYNLPATHRTIYLCMHLLTSHTVPLPHKCVKYILAKIFTFDHHLNYSLIIRKWSGLV